MVDELYAGTKCDELEFRTILPDGSLGFVSGRGEPKFDDENRLIQLAGTVQNITARKQAENQLDRFFDLSQDMMGIAGVDGHFKRINHAFTRVLGWSAGEILARPFLDFVHPDDQAATLREFERQVNAGEKVVQFENRYQHKDGSWRLLSWVSAPNEEDRLTLFATARDITERRKTELLVARNAKELADFKAALDQHAIVTIADKRGDITYANDKACEISKYMREELLGQNHRVLKSGHQPQALFDELWKTISSGQVWHGEIKNRAKDGSFYWVETTIVPFLDNHGKPVQYIAIRTDISERKRVEEAINSARETAEMANRAKDSFLATMSHEIRTPLGGMIDMLELLGYTPLNDDQRDTLQTAMHSSQSLLRIVNDILDWSKIEAGKLELAPRATSIAQLVTGVTNTYSRVASASSLILEQHVDERISPAHIVDPLRLSQVLNNFVSNAIKFTRKGQVEIRAELLSQEGNTEQVRFSVKDTGVGIEQEVQQRLFQSYSQESAETARMYGGTGLGLAICRSLAIMMNGSIDLESTPGLGSTFSITLNLPVSVIAPEQTLRMPIGKAFVQKRDVSIAKSATEGVPVALVVDDDPTNRKLMAIQLGLLGLHTECVENGELALARWRDGRFALVITDCHMPVMDGYEFARALRKIEASEKRSRTPIFAWSANALAEEGERCLAADMDELLVKPVGLTQLNDVLSRWLVVAAPDRPAHIALRESDDTQTAAANFMLLDELSDNAADKAEIVRDFMSQTRSDLAELEAAVAMLDFQGAMHIAHRMKGASRMIGARDIAVVCEEIEYAVRQGKPASTDVVKAALLQLKSHLAGVIGKYQHGKNQDKKTGNG